MHRYFRYANQLLNAVLNTQQRHQIIEMMTHVKEGRNHLHEGGLPALEAFLTRPSLPSYNSLDDALVKVDLVAALFRIKGLRHCMRRTVLMYLVLTRAAKEPTFVIGVERPGKGLLTGHAWVELDGEAFREYGNQHEQMTEIYRYPKRTT